MAFFTNNVLSLTDEQIKTIDAIYDTLIPGIEDPEEIDLIIQKVAPDDLSRHESIRNFLKIKGSRSTPTILKLFQNGNMITPSDLSELLLAINLLSTSWGTFILTGYCQHFSSLNQEQRESVFKSLLTSYLPQKRLLANTFRAMFLLVWSSDVVDSSKPIVEPQDLKDPFKLSGYNPNKVLDIWSAITYPGPNPDYNPTSSKWIELKEKNKIWTMPEFNFLSQYPKSLLKFSSSYKLLLSSQLPPISPLPTNIPGQLQYDVVIIGSGAGAGPVSLQLSQAGYRVLIIEQGSYNTPESHNGLEAEAFEKMYMNGACLTTTDKTMTVLAGTGFGGGTAINWSASLDTPHYIREEWANQFGMKFMTTTAFSTCLDRIKSIMQVHPHPDEHHNHPNTTLLKGAAKLGFATKTLAQNGLDKHNCGWCSTGCKLQQKQGSNVSFIPIAMNKYGTHVITDTRAEKIIFESFSHWDEKYHEIMTKADLSYQPPAKIDFNQLDLSHRYPQNTQHDPQIIPKTSISTAFIPQTPFNTTKKIATGVLVSYKDPISKELVQLTINAKIVVAAAGSLQTPLLLHRSGIKHRQLGKNLRLHPVIGVAAFYDHRTEPWAGTQMTSICTSHQNQYNNYGAIIETPNTHIGLTAGALPWWGGLNFKEYALRMDKLVPFICLTREMTSSGGVYDKEGKVQIDYNFTDFDRNHLLETIIAALKIHIEAGASELITPFSGIPSFRPDPILGISDPRFADYVNTFRQHQIVDHTVKVLSAHQMGTARMSSDPYHGPVDPTGEVHDTTNLFVADSSLFPTASGVNPMLTIMALSQYVSTTIQQRLLRLDFIDQELQKEGLVLFRQPNKQSEIALAQDQLEVKND